MKKAIEQVDLEINLKKKQCQQIIKWQNQIEERLESQKINDWWHIETENKDKLLEAQNHVLQQEEMVLVKAKSCKYQRYGCQAVYELKCRVRHDYGNRWLDLIYGSWQLLNLVAIMKKEWQKGEGEGKQQSIWFEKSPKGPSFILFQRMPESQKNDNELRILFLYWKWTGRKIERMEINGSLQQGQDFIRGTSLKSTGEDSQWLGLELNESMEYDLIKVLLKGVHELIQKGKRQKQPMYLKLEGCYIALKSYPLSIQKKWIHTFKALGYKAIGTMNKEGQFEPEQFLVRIENHKPTS